MEEEEAAAGQHLEETTSKIGQSCSLLQLHTVQQPGLPPSKQMYIRWWTGMEGTIEAVEKDKGSYKGLTTLYTD